MKKKGIIIVVALLLVAAILALVFVLLFKDKNTKSLATDLNSTVTTGYLSKENDSYKTVQNYLDEAEHMIGDEGLQLTNYRQAYEAYTTIALFFNNEVAFMNHTKTYSKNRKKIVSALKSAQKNADKMASAIEKNNKITGGTETWQRVVWNNYKDYVKDLVSDTMKAFELLSKVYAASVASEYMNNDLTDVLFMGIKELNSEFKNGVTKTPNLGYKLLTFATTSFNPANVEKAVLNFYYTSENNHKKMEDIKKNGTKSLYWRDVLDGNILF